MCRFAGRKYRETWCVWAAWRTLPGTDAPAGTRTSHQPLKPEPCNPPLTGNPRRLKKNSTWRHCSSNSRDSAISPISGHTSPERKKVPRSKCRIWGHCITSSSFSFLSCPTLFFVFSSSPFHHLPSAQPHEAPVSQFVSPSRHCD